MRTSSVFAILSVVALAGSAYIERDALAQPPIDVVPFTPIAEFSDDVAMQISVPHIIVRPTVNCVRAGRDEVLEAALSEVLERARDDSSIREMAKRR